ncbi:hypothetical protein [Dokdonella sp.]|uniref:hypothetical protein n=1 Tax=Dokdonella sp. TaxID=2291710 RepID=UPI003C59C787
MHSRALLLALILVLPLSAGALAQSQTPTFEERMSQTEFKAAGLEKLSPEELKYLNDWIQTKGVSQMGAPMIKADGSTIFYADGGERQLIESNISGEFNGWGGKTRVTLENGQVWEQAESGAKGGHRLSSPSVRVKPMSFGSWLMYVDGCPCDMRVKRIK